MLILELTSTPSNKIPTRAKLPVQNRNDPGLRRVKHDIVPIKIAMEDRVQLGDPMHVLFEPGELVIQPVGVTDFAAVVEVLDAGLLARETAPVGNVALVVARVLSESREPYFLVVNCKNDPM
jgi:hypothetical protein